MLEVSAEFERQDRDGGETVTWPFNLRVTRFKQQGVPVPGESAVHHSFPHPAGVVVHCSLVDHHLQPTLLQ